MKRLLFSVITIFFGYSLATSEVKAGSDPVADRAVNLAKQFGKDNNIKNPKINMLLNSLFRNAMPDFVAEWKGLTGIDVRTEPLGYTDIPSKIMGEAVAKTGAFDMFNDFPYTQPDAAGAKVIRPLDDFAAKGKPDFSGIPGAFLAQQRYNGKLYSMVLDGDHIMLVLRKDIVENPKARAAFKVKLARI